ncbi:MAG: recombinase family protein [Clostridia bacterium]|nr:recombinase family protein [Clostridia bacterium]
MNRQLNENRTTALYCRLSQDDGREGESNSIVNQKALLNEYARKNRFKNLRFFVDDGYSGTTFDRPAFREMEKMIENGEIGTVIVKDMSRLGRNYLQVGMYTDIVFPDNDVRFIAINDNVDSAVQTEFDMTPIRNFCNELYARDTAKKIKSSFAVKGNHGEHLATRPPLGYKKDEKNPNKWVIDEPAAEIIRKIFKLCVSGMGPQQIASQLEEEKVLTPTAYLYPLFGELGDRDPYHWDHNTIGKILERQEYVGNTVNFKTTAKNYRSKKRIMNDKENRKTFEDTHPAIIDAHTFEIVQKMRQNKRRRTATGRFQLFSGKLFCADCGAKLHFAGSNTNEKDDHYTCANYRSNKGTCTAHYIRNSVLYDLVFKHIKSMLVYVQQFEETFVRREIEKADRERQTSVESAKKEIVMLKHRDEELDRIFKRTYEDMVSGRISEARFDTLSAGYEEEQANVKRKIVMLENLIENGEEQVKDLKQLLANVRKYTDPDELTSEMLNDLVDKILVHAPDKSTGHRTQKIEIYYNAVGIIDLPTTADSKQDPSASKLAV